MKTVNIHEAKTNFSAIINEIENGEQYIICRNGHPVAELIKYKKTDRLKRHPVYSKIKIKYDPTEEISEEEWGEPL